MDRALPRPPAVPWRHLAFTIYVAVNLGLLLSFGTFAPAADWHLWRALSGALANGTLYDPAAELPYVWSPVVAPVQALVGIMGMWPSAILTLLIPLLLRDRWVAVLIYSSFMFWPTVLSGSPLFVLTLVAGIGAMRGSRRWALVYLALTVLIPRPLQLPLAVLVLWRDPSLRLPTAVLVLLHAVAVVGSGYAADWIAAMLAHDAPGFRPAFSLALGDWWPLAGLPLAAILTWRGWPAWAGLVVSPYILHGYLLWPLIDHLARRGDVVDHRGLDVRVALVEDRDAQGVDRERDRGRRGVPAELDAVLAEPHRQR